MINSSRAQAHTSTDAQTPFLGTPLQLPLNHPLLPRTRASGFRASSKSEAQADACIYVGSPHRAQISQIELFELILLSRLDKQLPVKQIEATASQSTVPITAEAFATPPPSWTRQPPPRPPDSIALPRVIMYYPL